MGEPRLSKLTLRQKDCLRLVAQGYTSKEIGRQLSISYSTVDNHLLAAVQALDMSNRAEAARLLIREESDSSGQQLPRQPQPLAAPPVLADPSVGQPREWRKVIFPLLPPIGGKENDLSQWQTLFAITRIAFLSVLAFIACVMVVKMSFNALS